MSLKYELFLLSYMKFYPINIWKLQAILDFTGCSQVA